MGSNPALTPTQVKRIRKAYNYRTRTLKQLAVQEKVSVATIFKAVNRITPYDRNHTRKELP